MERWNLKKNPESENEKKLFRRTLIEKNNNPVKDLESEFSNLKITQTEVIDAKPYQQKIFEQIIDRNSIIYAETGRGKTYIATMLMKYILRNEKNQDIISRSIVGLNSVYIKKTFVNSKKKDPKIIFIVPENSLLEQQTRAIEKHIGDYKVTKILGGKTDRYTSSKPNFEVFLSQNDVFVSTHEIVYRFLYSGFLHISDIRLLVFDECHHTDLNHPYNIIMNEFYFFNKINGNDVKLPQILGLTASPIKRNLSNVNSSKIDEELVKLSENMDCFIVMDPDVFEYKIEKGHDDLEKLSPDEAKREYIQMNNFYEQENYDKLIKVFTILFAKLLEEANISLSKDVYLEFVISRLLSKDFQEFATKINEKVILFKEFSENKIIGSIEKFLKHVFILLENTNMLCIYNLLVDYKEEIKKDTILKSTNMLKVIDKFSEFLMKQPFEYESDRFTLLKDFILKTFKDNKKKLNKNRIIIFVDHRVVAKYLENEINEFLEENLNNKEEGRIFKSLYIVGVSKNKRSGKNINNTQNEMIEKLKTFNKGEVQILIATSTVEEGIDIRDCDIVIVYTELKTVKSYIQMKGRARKKNAQFIIFTESEVLTRARIKDFIEIIKLIREKFVGKSFVVDLRRKNFLSSKNVDRNLLRINSSKAQVSLRNAAQLYNHLKNLFSNHQIVLKPNIQYSKNGMDHSPKFVCIFQIDDPYIYIESDMFNKKDQSLAHCYLKFIELMLHEGVIDDYFNVINIKFFR